MPRPATVAVYGEGGSPDYHAALLAQAGHRGEFNVLPVIRAVALELFGVFAMPGGGCRAMLGHLDPLESDGTRAVDRFVAGGGMYADCCAGAYPAATVGARFMAACPFQSDMRITSARVGNYADGDFVGRKLRGVGRPRVKLALPEHPVAEGLPETFEITHYHGPFLTGGKQLQNVVGTADEFTPAQRLGDPSQGRPPIEAAVVAVRHGRGRVVLFGSRTEFGSSFGTVDRRPPLRMLLNGARRQVREGLANRLLSAEPVPALADPAARSSELRALVEIILTKAAAVHPIPWPFSVTVIPRSTLSARSRAAIEWRARRGNQPARLRPGTRWCIFRLPQSKIWCRSLELIPACLTEASHTIGEVDPAVVYFGEPVDTEYGSYHAWRSSSKLLSCSGRPEPTGPTTPVRRPGIPNTGPRRVRTTWSEGRISRRQVGQWAPHRSAVRSVWRLHQRAIFKGVTH